MYFFFCFISNVFIFQYIACLKTLTHFSTLWKLISSTKGTYFSFSFQGIQLLLGSLGHPAITLFLNRLWLPKVCVAADCFSKVSHLKRLLFFFLNCLNIFQINVLHMLKCCLHSNTISTFSQESHRNAPHPASSWPTTMNLETFRFAVGQNWFFFLRLY